MRAGFAAAAATVIALGAACRSEGGDGGSRAAADTAIVSESIAFFEARVAADRNNYPVAARLVSRYLTRFALSADPADLARAETLSRRLTLLAPDRAEAMSRLSGVLLAQHKFAEALDAAREAVAAAPRDDEALGALFDATLATGARAEAKQALQAMRPGSLGTLVRRAQWLEDAGQGDGARLAMDRACRTVERSGMRPATVAWCLTELAGLEHRERGPAAAEAVLRRALKIQPGYRAAIEGLADFAAADDEWATAYGLYRRIATDAHPDLYLRLAEAAGRMGRNVEQASWERRFLEVVRLPGGEAMFGAELALFLSQRGRKGDLAAALAIAEREVERRPTAESFDLLSWVHYRRGDAVAALAASDHALAAGGGSPTIDYHRGRILLALGRAAEGSGLLRRAEAHRSLLPPHARLAAGA